MKTPNSLNFRDITPLPLVIPPTPEIGAPRPLHDSKWLKLESIPYTLNGIDKNHERASRQQSAGVVEVFPIDTADRVALILQFRVATGSWVLETPAGLIDPPKPGKIGETPEEAVQRELAEETGYSVSPENIKFIAETQALLV